MSTNQSLSVENDEPKRGMAVEATDTTRAARKLWDCRECRAISPLQMLTGTLIVEHSADSRIFGRAVSIENVPFTIGRQDCDLTFADAQGVSRKHAQITFQDGVYFIADTGSTNHTFVDDVALPVNVPTPLYEGAVIRLGAFTVMRFKVQDHRNTSRKN